MHNHFETNSSLTDLSIYPPPVFVNMGVYSIMDIKWTYKAPVTMYFSEFTFLQLYRGYISTHQFSAYII